MNNKKSIAETDDDIFSIQWCHYKTDYRQILTMQGSQTFDELLQKLALMISKHQLSEIKKGLLGHIDKESIDEICKSYDLFLTLQRKRLLNENKLEFLKKLLQFTDNRENIVKIIQHYKDLRKQERLAEKTDNHGEHIAGLRIIEDRQEVTRDEYNNTLQKLQYNYQILLDEKDSILKSVNNTKKDLAEYNNMKVDIVQKYNTAFNRCEEKLKEIKREEGILTEKQIEQNKLTGIVTEFQERLNKRGESRLNTFNRMLEKEELKTVQKHLDEQNEKVSVQKQYLYQLKFEHDAYTSKKHMKLHNVRNVSEKILHAIESLNALYKKLEELNKRSLVTNKEIMKQKLLLSEIEQELATTKVKIENEMKGDNIGTSALKKIAALTKKIKSETRTLDYEILGSNTLSLGYHGTSSTHLQFDHPTSVAINSKDHILVNDSKNKRLVLFTLYGQIVDIIVLDTLRIVDITITKQDYIVAVGKTIIRIYEGQEIIYQFLPHYIPNKMELPILVSTDFNNETNQIYLLDKANLAIHIFNDKFEFTEIKDLHENVTMPTKLHIVNKNEFLITDEYDHCIKHFHYFTKSLCACKSYGRFGIGILEFARPSGISHDAKNNFIVVDKENHRIKIMNSMGNVTAKTGILGSSSNSFNHPYDVAVTSNGFIIVTDELNHRVVLYF